MIAVECDDCGSRVAAEKNKRFGMGLMRMRLARVGWSHVEHSGRDYCPECWKKRNQETGTVPAGR